MVDLGIQKSGLTGTRESHQGRKEIPGIFGAVIGVLAVIEQGQRTVDSISYKPSVSGFVPPVSAQIFKDGGLQRALLQALSPRHAPLNQGVHSLRSVPR